MKQLVLVSVVALALVGCPKPPLPPEPPHSETNIVPTNTDRCGPGCDHLKALKCEEGKGPDPSDPNSCKVACEYVQKNGLRVNPKCWETITACDQIDKVCK